MSFSNFPAPIKMKYQDKSAYSFSLFANCFITRGITRSIVIDAYRGGFDFIPNDLYDILAEDAAAPLAALYAQVGEENIPVLDEYLDFLLGKDYIFWHLPEEKASFPPLPTLWNYPGKISNAILDWDAGSSYPLLEIIAELDHLQCQALQFRSFAPLESAFLEELFTGVHQSTIEQLDLILHYGSNLTEDQLHRWAFQYQKLSNIQVHSAPMEKVVREGQIDKICTILYTRTEIRDESHCGVIGLPYFSTNIPHYMESQFHNTCLHRKVSVDRRGLIKNCPSLNRHFGQAGKMALAQAIDNPAFQERWHIRKDQVRDCQVCEFRHICTDCRAYLQDQEDVYSKPAKCNYNPYLGIWEDRQS